jgi:predicted DNA-binding transcriptional regulator YafY
MEGRSRIGRLLGILLVLRSKEWVLAQELAERFSVSLRTIYRDIETIQRQGIPVHGVPGPDGGYRLETEGPIDPLQFADEDAMSLYLFGAIGPQLPDTLQQGAQEAVSKLSGTLRPQDRKLLRMIRSRVYFDTTDWYWSDHGTGYLPQLREALVNERLLAIRYRQRGASHPELFDVAPYGLVWKGGEWYLVGRLEGRSSVERIRVSRMKSVGVLKRGFTSQPSFNLKKWWTDEIERYGKGPIRVRLIATRDARTELLTLQTKDSSTIEERNGLTILTLYVDRWNWLIPLVLSYGESVVVEEPNALREAVVKVMENTLRRYRTGTTSVDDRFVGDDSRRRATRGRIGSVGELLAKD